MPKKRQNREVKLPVLRPHAAGTDNRHLPDFLGIEPAILNEGAAIAGEVQIHHRDILNASRDVAIALATYAQWPFLEQMQND